MSLVTAVVGEGSQYEIQPRADTTSRVLKPPLGVQAFGGGIEKIGRMGESHDPQLAMLTTLSPEDLIRGDHPIRRIRAVVDAVLAELDDRFDAMYAAGAGRACRPSRC